MSMIINSHRFGALSGALVFVGGYVQGYEGTTSDISFPLTSLVGGIASAPAANDVVILALGIGSGNNVAKTITGWTQVVDLYANDTKDANLLVYTKVMSGSPDTTITIPGGTGSTGNGAGIAVHVWRGIDPSIMSVPPTTASFTNTAYPTPAAITPIDPDSQIIICTAAGHERGSVGFVNPGYLSNFFTAGADDSHDGSVAIGSVLWPGGVYTPSRISLNGENDGRYSSVACTMAIKPVS